MNIQSQQSAIASGTSRPLGRQFERRAFTLIEMLVALGIFVILATMVMGAFRTDNSDRVRAASSTFRNALDGARSRALRTGETRGLRLIPDPNDPRMITSFIYVGTAETVEGQLQVMPPNTTNNTFQVYNYPQTNPAVPWSTLGANGLIQTSSRIEIPARSGKWYPISVPPATNEIMTISGLYRPGEWISGSYVAQPENNTGTIVNMVGESLPIPYRLELAPTVIDGAEPITMATQTCIDLDGSVVPNSWRNSSTGAPLKVHYDILFSPQGTVVGDAAATGVLHFHIAHIDDVLKARENASAVFPLSTPSPQVFVDPKNAHKAISLFARTGAVVGSDIAPSSTPDNGIFNDQYEPATNAYQMALRGREAKE